MWKRNRVRAGERQRGCRQFGLLKGEVASLKVSKGEAPDEEFEFALTQAAKRFDIPKRKLRNWVDDVDRDAQRGDRETLPITIEEANKRVDGLKQDLVVEMARLAGGRVLARYLRCNGIPVRARTGPGESRQPGRWRDAAARTPHRRRRRNRNPPAKAPGKAHPGTQTVTLHAAGSRCKARRWPIWAAPVACSSV